MVRWIAATLLLAGCMGAHNDSKEGFPSNPNDGGPIPVQQQQNLPKPAAFDGARAMGYLKSICDIGPRIAGTQGMKKQQDLMRKHFEDLGLKVTMQHFRAKQTTKAEVNMANMIVSFAPEKTRRVILCSHYDTRPIADREGDRRRWHDSFISANDGGSGVALLMELANHLKGLKTEVGVDLVFFDGEEYIWNKDRDKYFFGSEFFARTWAKTNPHPDYVAAILLDMIGGKDLSLPMERGSFFKAEELCREVWGLAKNLNVNVFRYEVTEDKILDDHIALQDAGIPAIDIIDFDYRHWHKLSDIPDNCSGESMAKVATVLSVWLQTVK